MVLPIVQARRHRVRLPAAAARPPKERSPSGARSTRCSRRSSGADALAIGPGLARDAETAGFVRRPGSRCPVPLVLDADGLNAFEGARRGAAPIARRDAGAHARTTASSPGSPGLRRRDARIGSPPPARSRAHRTRWSLLKGTRTLVADTGGRGRVNPTGGPVLATAGTGDVLTGIDRRRSSRAASSRVDAAMAGTYMHGLAGMLADDARGGDRSQATSSSGCRRPCTGCSG